MFQLTYKSKASEFMSTDDVAAILKTARARNKEKGITGCLVFHNNCFVQIIEGKKKQVKSLYQEIVNDKRHGDIQLIWEGEIEERSFSDWSMGYFDPAEAGVHHSDAKEFEQNLLLLSELSDSHSATLRMFWLGVKKLLIGEGC